MATKQKEHPALEAVRASGTGKVKVAVSDIDGILRGKYLHIDKFMGAAQPHRNGGFGFCDVVFGWDANDNCYDNATLTGWQHGVPRRAGAPWTWTPTVACRGTTTCRSFLGDFVKTDGTPSMICPRQTLKRVFEAHRKLGVSVMAGKWSSSGSTSTRRAELGWQVRRRPRADHAGHVRLLATAHEPQAANISRR